MLDIQKTTIEKLVNVLIAVKAEFKIILPDGSEYGELAAQTKRKAKDNRHRGYIYKRGETKAYYEPLVRDLGVGDAVLVPYDRFDPTVLSGNIGSWAGDTWGPGNYSTSKGPLGVGLVRFA
jgi:hypothetical protein